MQTIPFRQDAQWRQDISLDGTTYILTFKWNALNEYWTMNIYNGDFDPIALGIKIVTQWNLTEQIVQTGMPLGNIICQNIVGQFQKIERNDMGLTNALVYYSEGEI